MIQRITGYVLASLVLLAGWYIGLHRPNVARIAALSEALATAQARIDEYDRTMARLPEFLDKDRQFKSMARDLNSSLYAKGNILALLDDLHLLANQQRMKITEITPPVSELLALNDELRNPDSPLFLNLTVILEGDYERFGRFVGLLEQRKFFRSINHCQVLGSRVSPESPQFSVGFRALLSLPEAAS